MKKKENIGKSESNFEKKRKKRKKGKVGKKWKKKKSWKKKNIYIYIYIYIYNIINYCCNPSTAHLGHDPLVIPSYMYNNV
jgi:hypothetical protein